MQPSLTQSGVRREEACAVTVTHAHFPDYPSIHLIDALYQEQAFADDQVARIAVIIQLATWQLTSLLVSSRQASSPLKALYKQAEN
jgi:hypothetical protein